MKNIHLIPTDKPSRLHLGNSGLVLCDLNFGKNTINGQNIYITSNEEIKDEDYFIALDGSNDIYKANKEWLNIIKENPNPSQKIILTTDQDLIKDGVQAIDDEFLEWFVKNPTCEFVKIEHNYIDWIINNYKIIIPQEEPKQEYEYIGECNGNNDNGCFLDSCGHDCGCFERVLKQSKQETLEEAAEHHWKMQYLMALDESIKHYVIQDFIAGAKWQAERLYSEEDLLSAFEAGMMFIGEDKGSFREWLRQFKKK
jgi:hypothetical protein